MCPGEMRREAYFPIFIKALQKGGHMNQYLEQWVGKELTKELEEGIRANHDDEALPAFNCFQ